MSRRNNSTSSANKKRAYALNKIGLIGVFILLSACVATTRTTKENPMYKGAKVELAVIEKADNTELAKIKKDIEGAIRPQKMPSPIRQWIYYTIKNPKERRIRGFIKSKFGRPPVYLNKVAPEKNISTLKKLLINKGYFHSDVSYQLITKKNKSQINYIINLPKRYKISRIQYPSSDTEITKEIHKTKLNSRINIGDYYDLAQLAAERKEITAQLKNKGYYKFREEFLFFRADTNAAKQTVELTMLLKADIPKNACNKFKIANVIVNPDLRDKNDTLGVPDTTYYRGSTRIEKYVRVKNKTLFNALLIHKDSLYNAHKHQLSTKRLMNLGVFKSVNIDYKVLKDSVSLDCYVSYHTLQEQELKANFELTTKSNSFTGPGLELGYRNLNVFKGAENLSLKLNSGFETQFNSNRTGLESLRVGGDVVLTLPKLLLPIRFNTFKNSKPPETKVNIGYQLLNRPAYYTINSFSFNGGYHFFTKNKRQTFELYPFAINYARLSKTTSAFEDILQENVYYAKSFEQQYILGSQYTYRLNKNSKESRLNYYLEVNLDNSGNLYQVLKKAFKLENNPTFSQYSKISIDSRNYLKIKGEQLLAFRFYSGFGIPHGSSDQLPYVKQFYSGGANSVRAFPIRSIGPGNYTLLDSLKGKTFFDQAGDIKLELNCEYRFPIIGYLKGALFADAGNVWLYKKFEALPGGEFSVSNFYKQLAVGMGAGLRIDVSSFVVRFDAAIPLRSAASQSWILNKSNLGNSVWRKQNRVFNLAIGYPF